MNPVAIGWQGIRLGGGSMLTAGAIYFGTMVAQSDAQTSRQIAQNFPDVIIAVDGSTEDFFDLIANDSLGDDSNTPHSSILDLAAITPGVTEIIRFCPASFPRFCCLHDHVRERAPPSLRT